MTALNAQLSISPQGGYVNANVTVALRSTDSSWIGWPTFQLDMGVDGTGYALTRNTAPAHSIVINGQSSQSYMDDYYYRIHLTPATIDLGSLLTSQTRSVRLWNAYLEPVEITALTAARQEGASISAPAGFDVLPFTLNPLQQITYELTVTLNGPSTLDSVFAWESDHGGAEVRVIGSRITMFPFIPDWIAGIDETLSARSSLLRSPDGTEQSISLRNRFRRSYGIPYSLGHEDAQLADNLLFGWQGRLYGVPAWPEQDYLTSPIVSGSSVASAPVGGKTIQAGSLVMVFSGKRATDAEIKEVLSVTSTSLTVKTPFVNDWPAGSRVVPVLLGAAAPQLQGTRLVPNYLQMAIQFDLQPLSTDDNAPDVAPATLYRGYELYLGRTNWRDNIAIGVQTDVQRIDMQTGVFRLRPQSGFSNIGRSHEWFLKTFDDVSAFRRWLKRRLGKTIGVWMPSAMEDFTLAGTVAGNTLSVPVKSNGYALMVTQHEARRDIYIRLRDGSYLNRRIVDSADNGDGITTLLLDAVLGKVVNPEDVMQFSYLSFYRMASDDTVIHWHAPGKAEAVTGLIPTKALT